MLSTATCVACHFPLSSEDKVCPRCGRPVSLLDSDMGISDAAGSLGGQPSIWAAPTGESTGDAQREQRYGDPSAASRLGASPTLSSSSGSLRPLPPRPVVSRNETRLDEVASGDAGTAAFMPPPPSESADSANMISGTGSLPVRPAGSADSPRSTDFTPRAWDASAEFMPAPDLPTVTPAPPPPNSFLIGAAPVATIPPPPAPLPIAAPAPVADAKSTAGALVLLPGEELIMQLGALYLTNRRAILYAPTILRSAFLRDVDAIGTLTERSSGWIFFLSLVMLALSAGGIYMLILSNASNPVNFLGLTSGSLLLIAIPLAVLGLILMVTYFFWVKRSLFLSVGGRPLIVVSISAWNQRKLESVDGFVNAFSQAKDNIERDNRY